MRKFLRPTAVAISVSAILTGCAGGGGSGSGSGYLNTGGGYTYNQSVIRAGTVKTLSGSQSSSGDISALHTVDIDNTGGEELIITGRMDPSGGSWENYDISIFGWSNGQLVDQSTHWFGTINRRVLGTEQQVRFGDFDGDGNKDMYAGPYSDTAIYGGVNGAATGAVFFSSGGRFVDRHDVSMAAIGNSSALGVHDSTVIDMNNDGRDDIVSIGAEGGRVMLGNANRTFTTLEINGNPGSGSAIAVADFLGNGTKTVIIADQLRTRANTNHAGNNLYYFQLDMANSRANFWGVSNLAIGVVTELPDARFISNPYWGVGGGGHHIWGANPRANHDVRVMANINLAAGRNTLAGEASDAVIVSRPWVPGNWGINASDIQFLKNNGHGLFTDITGVRNDGTDGVLKDYNFLTSPSYNPVFKDVNNDGKLDIVLASMNWNSNSGSQILIWQPNTINGHGFQYQASYAVTMESFQNAALNNEKSLSNVPSWSNSNGANGVALLHDATGNLYVATAVNFDRGGENHKAIYITPLNSMTPAATLAAIRTNWPWMTDAQIQTILNQSTTTYFGLSLLDPSRALAPQGALSMPTANGMREIRGTIAGLKLGDNAKYLLVRDDFGRTYEINYSSTQLNSQNLWATKLDSKDDSAKATSLASELKYDQVNGFRYGATPDNRIQIFGMPEHVLGQDFYATWQFTNLPYSPWLNITGSWGLIKSSATTEVTIAWRPQGWRLRGGVMYTSTQIESGLVTRITPITALWGDVGYVTGGWSLSAGTLPKIISGSADLTLPTSVDNNGTVRYTNITANFDNPLTGFARLGYQGRISKKVTFNAAAMVSTQDSHSVKMEIKSSW